MTDQPAIADDVRDRIGPGRMLAVVGPSGAGKDTLIDRARTACRDDDRVVFPRRVVTRAASRFEDNTEISVAAFHLGVERGEFALHWQAHGHCYALSRAIDDDIRAGRAVIANVSRSVIPTLRRRYADLRVVLVTAPPDILAARLAARGRGSDGQIAERLGRAADNEAVAPDLTIVNIGRVEDHADELLRAIRGR